MQSAASTDDQDDSLATLEADSDEELMRRYCAGDRSAFRELFARYQPIVFGLARRRVACDQLAADVCQQTFLNLHRARLDFRQGNKLRPWLLTIAMNLVREHHRGRGRRRECELEHEPTEDAVGLGQLEGRELCARVRTALSALPRDQRRVIEMHWLEERPFPEVARALGQRTSTVKVRAHRGYKKLREALLSSAPELAT